MHAPMARLRWARFGFPEALTQVIHFCLLSKTLEKAQLTPMIMDNTMWKIICQKG